MSVAANHVVDEARALRNLTFRYELQRAFATGIVETAAGTFLLLIAIRCFEAGATMKGLVAMGGAGGNLFSPVAVMLTARRGVPASRAASRMVYAAGLAFALAAILPWEWPFVLGSLVGLLLSTAAIPLFTQIYQDNYAAHERGKLFSMAIAIRIATAAGFSLAAGWAIQGHFEHFQKLLGVFALALFWEGWSLARVPSNPLARTDSNNPLYALRFIREDKTFRNALIAWMLVGFANLMMVPLRVEYLANPRYGVLLGGKPLTAAFIAVLTGVIPNLARLGMSPVWGKLFDRVNFFVLRIAINLGFAIAILTFFTGNSFSGLIAGAIIFGISNAGGDLAWSLWVTKVAPPHRVAHYMSVHTFLTGCRGIVAPLVAFQLVKTLPLLWMGVITSSLIVLACLVLIPEIGHYRHRHAPRNVEELPES
jgi:MFS family permease